MADVQIMIWDTKRPKTKPYLSDQFTLNFLQQKYGARYQMYSEAPQEPNIVEVKKKVNPVVVSEIIAAPAEVVVPKGVVERKITTTKTKRRKKKT